MSQAPRRINTDRSLNRPDQAAKAAPRPAAGTTGTSGRPAAGSTSGSGRSAPPRHSAQPARQVEPPRRRKKKKKTPLWLPFAVVMAVIAVVSGVVVYGVSMLNKVEDSLRPDDSTPTIQEEVKTAEEYKGDVVNILVCGIDYEEGRNYSDASSNDGMTDMILYCQFDIKNGALHMLQIPRNSLVATQNRKITLSNGKTYAASNYQINSVALSNGGSIAALADVIYDQYRLPVDYYVSVDMQALVEMVDNFGGIEVYIPHDMSYGGSKLVKGYRNLDGASAEFFVRCRHGDGYANSDLRPPEHAALFLRRPVQACPLHGRDRHPEPAAAGVQELYQDGYGHLHHRKAGGVLPEDRQFQHHPGPDAGVHGRAQCGQDRQL